mmetsp:Transcript_3058/g.5788  ORF Transcript_3058/g.5788 Transcript_3058/m.5788 type:complete len:226 (-) Transcript_3058:127-804(-)
MNLARRHTPDGLFVSSCLLRLMFISIISLGCRLVLPIHLVPYRKPAHARYRLPICVHAASPAPRGGAFLVHRALHGIEQVQVVHQVVVYQAVRALHEDGAGAQGVRVHPARRALAALVAGKGKPLSASLVGRVGQRAERLLERRRQVPFPSCSMKHNLHAGARAHALKPLLVLLVIRFFRAVSEGHYRRASVLSILLCTSAKHVCTPAARTLTKFAAQKNSCRCK